MRYVGERTRIPTSSVCIREETKVLGMKIPALRSNMSLTPDAFSLHILVHKDVTSLYD